MSKIILSLSFLFVFVQQTTAKNDIDTLHGFEAPGSVSNDYRELTQFLIRDQVTDQGRANMIYNWITHNISYDIEASKDPDRDPAKVENVLKSKKTTTEGYNLLFKEMCMEAGLLTNRVEGYMRVWYFDNGDTLYIPNHEWSTVLIDGQWEIVDLVHGAGHVSYRPGWFREQLNKLTKDKVYYSKKGVFLFEYDPQYFMIDPLVYRMEAVPVNPMWQLYTPVMPVTTFEAGRFSVQSYNDENSNTRISNTQKMEGQTLMSDKQYVISYAKDINEYNDLYVSKLGEREAYLAISAVENIDLTTLSAEKRDVVKKRLSNAKTYFEEQQEYLEKELRILKRKNIDKKIIAKDRFRDISIDNKLLVSQCDKYISLLERGGEVKDDKNKVLSKKGDVSLKRFAEIKVPSIAPDPNSPIAQAQRDSMLARDIRIEKTNKTIDSIQQQLKECLHEDDTLYTLLNEALYMSDTALKLETEARLNLRDDYDDIVKKCVDVYKEYKFQGADTAQLFLQNNVDTILDCYKRLESSYRQNLNNYKQLIRGLEQYKRWEVEDTAMLRLQHYKMVVQYQQFVDGYAMMFDQKSKQLSALKEHFENLKKGYKEEIDLIEYMEKGENARNELEEKDITETNNYNEKILQKKIAGVEKMLDELEENK